MRSWAQQRKVKIVSGIASFVVLAFVVWVLLPERSSCFNNVRDGNERGIDCGGSCRLLCQGEALDPLIHFARAVPVAPFVWGAVAYVENRNENAGARAVPYVFKLYDAQNLLLFERHGEAYIPPRKVFALFEGRMEVGSRLPARATFAFTASPRFEVMPPQMVLPVRNTRFVSEEGSSRLEAVLSNPTLTLLLRIEATAVLFDHAGNVFAASATKVPRLPPGGAVTLSFTWPRVFKAPPARMEILYTIPP